MNSQDITEIIVALLGGGGLATAFFTWLNGKKKNSNDIVQSNIVTALNLRNEAMGEYKTVKEKLDEARKLLDEAQEQLTKTHEYIGFLQRLLTSHGVEFPTYEDYTEEKEEGRNGENRL